MPTLELHVGRRESKCPLWVGCALIERLPQLLPLQSYSSIVVVADSGAEQAKERVCSTLHIPQNQTLSVKGGEEEKSVEGVVHIWKFFAEAMLDRRSLVVSIGGGATSDLVGFAASTYMRGVSCVHVPTTLLAQVDASVGGKTGINFEGVKNLIGSITQPVGVVIDIDTLSTLPERELRSGFAEIVKHGLIADRSYFDTVTSKDCSLWTEDDKVHIISRSCEIKKAIVEADENEKGLRKILNFGHSIGHAVESLYLTRGPKLTHGEAISIGMFGESYISHRIGNVSAEDLSIIEGGLLKAGLPTRLPSPIPPSDLLSYLTRDKKNVGRKIVWTLLQKIGVAVFDVVIPEELIADALNVIQPKAQRV